MTDLAFTSAAELAAMIRKREVSPVEVMSQTLARIEESQPALNAFITIAADAAMKAAQEAEGAVMRGASLGSLKTPASQSLRGKGIASLSRGLHCEI